MYFLSSSYNDYLETFDGSGLTHSLNFSFLAEKIISDLIDLLPFKMWF